MWDSKCQKEDRYKRSEEEVDTDQMMELAADRLEEEDGLEEVSDGDGDEENKRDPPEHMVNHMSHVQELLDLCGC